MDNVNIRFVRLNSNEERPSFDCKDKDLNEFFHVDSKNGAKDLTTVTYAVETNEVLAAFFCVSNDSIRKEDTTPTKFRKIQSGMTPSKKFSSMPAVKIGRLATIEKGNGIGTLILDLIKVWFTKGNKTGCRFIIVDARNSPKVLNFYKKNGFKFLDTDIKCRSERTRLMFFDLFTFVNSD